jgi:hypothetical protein
MHISWEAGMLFSAWADLDEAVADVTPEDMLRRIDGGSSFAWTLAHVTHAVDSWINVRFQGLSPQQLVHELHFRVGGDGQAEDWGAIQAAVAEVRSRARPHLEAVSEGDLARVLPYEGGYAAFREHGIQLRVAVLQNAAHHFLHLGEIVTRRSALGYDGGYFPRSLVFNAPEAFSY